MHLLHSECADEWFQVSRSCPICRTNMETHQAVNVAVVLPARRPTISMFERIRTRIVEDVIQSVLNNDIDYFRQRV